MESFLCCDKPPHVLTCVSPKWPRKPSIATTERAATNARPVYVTHILAPKITRTWTLSRVVSLLKRHGSGRTITSLEWIAKSEQHSFSAVTQLSVVDTKKKEKKKRNTISLSECHFLPARTNRLVVYTRIGKLKILSRAVTIYMVKKKNKEGSQFYRLYMSQRNANCASLEREYRWKRNRMIPGARLCQVLTTAAASCCCWPSLRANEHLNSFA
jgi:hypothetical protein